jgi:DNA-binding CsgD family transcriptional regulator
MTTEKIWDVVNSLYEAAEDSTLWPNALQKIAVLTRATAVSLPLFTSLQSPSLGLLGAVNLDDTFRREHSTYAHLNPYFVRGSHWFSEGKPLLGEMIIPEREFLNTSYYNDFLRHFDLFYHCGGAVLKQPSLVAVLRINRPGRRPPFGQKELAILGVLMPHLKRALQLHFRLHSAEVTGRSLLAGIDALPTGFVLVDSHGKIVLMNQSAEAILRQNDGLSCRAQCLQISEQREAEKLRQAVVAATQMHEISITAPHAIAVSRPSLLRPYFVLVFPLRMTNLSIGMQSPAALIFIADPEREQRPNRQVLRDLFGLTAAECRLAEVLSRGTSLREAAEQLGITDNTVHSHLQHIFDKTQTNRQVELLRILNGSLTVQEPRKAA